MISTSHPEKSIFISYRRDDSAFAAGRIHDWLKRELPDWTIYFDISSISAGENFRAVIEKSINQSGIMLAIIGKDWIGNLNSSRDPRIYDVNDVVRFEIASALSSGLRVIPVLVNDARMPQASSLPPEIQPLALRNAAEIRHSRFDDDLRNLISGLAKEYIAKPPSGVSRNIRRKLKLFAAGFSGAILSLSLLFGALAIQFHLTGHSLDYWIGFDGVLLMLASTALGGYYAGSLVWRRRATRTTLI